MSKGPLSNHRPPNQPPYHAVPQPARPRRAVDRRPPPARNPKVRRPPTTGAAAGAGTGYRAVQRGEFWECHETLEDVWRESPYPFRLFYHAVIKTAVGFHHLTAHNRHGARVKLRDGVELLELFQPEWMGVRTDSAPGRRNGVAVVRRSTRRRVGRTRPPRKALDLSPLPSWERARVRVIPLPAPTHTARRSSRP